MGKTIFLVLLFLVFIFSFGLSFTILYHFQRFKPVLFFQGKKIISALFFGYFFFLLISIISFLLI